MFVFFLTYMLAAVGFLREQTAENEFQALQFIPVVIAPQVILGGTFLPVEELPTYLEWPARAMPITYLIEGTEYVVLDRGTAEDAWLAMGVLALLTVLSIAAATVAIRRID